MPEKATATDSKVEVEELRNKIVELEAERDNLQSNVQVVNSVLGDYQQQLADAQLLAATYKARLAVAVGANTPTAQ